MADTQQAAVSEVNTFQEKIISCLLEHDTNIQLLKEYLRTTDVNEVTIMAALKFQTSGYDNCIKQWLSNEYLEPVNISDAAKFNGFNEEIKEREEKIKEREEKIKELEEKIKEREEKIKEFKEKIKELTTKNTITDVSNKEKKHTHTINFISKVLNHCGKTVSLEKVLTALDKEGIEIPPALFQQLDDEGDDIVMTMTFKNPETIFNASQVYLGFVSKDVFLRFADRNKFNNYQQLAELYVIDPVYYGDYYSKRIADSKIIFTQKIPEFEFEKRFEVAKAKHIIAMYEK